MIMIFVFLGILFLPERINSQLRCPEKYQRLSDEHSFCKRPSRRCQFLKRGIENPERTIQEILDLHNQYRSKVATGQESEAIGGKLPPASNMLEMSWDEELAEIAQKWAEQCNFEHDCRTCRATLSYFAGQTIAYVPNNYCPYTGCVIEEPDWNTAMQLFYDEVQNFDKSIINSMNTPGPEAIGDFTQVVWAQSYKVGCGYVAYKEMEFNKELYVCNYGPAGNIIGEPIYKKGPPCSECPTNSECTNTEGENVAFPGLCRLTGIAPDYSRSSTTESLYLCNFSNEEPSCAFEGEGNARWYYSTTESGTFLTLVLVGGDNFMVHFEPTIVVPKIGACMHLIFRKGPNMYGDEEANKLQVIFKQNGQTYPVDVWSYPSADFVHSLLNVMYNGTIKISLKYSVPADALPQYLEVKEIRIDEEPCK